MFRKLIPISLLTFVNVIGFTILIPILPGIIDHYAITKNIALMYGAMTTAYALSQFLAAPYLGSLSDKYGRRPILLLSQAGTLFSWIIFAIAYFLPEGAQLFGLSAALVTILASRVIDGLTGGNTSVAQAWVSDITTKENKTKAFGIVGASFAIGFLIGPAIGGITASSVIGYLGTVIFAFSLSLVTLGFVYFFLPETLTPEHRIKGLKIDIHKEINVFSKFSIYNDDPRMKSLLYVRIAYGVVLTGYTTMVTFILSTVYMLSFMQIAVILSLVGILFVICQAIIAPNLSKKYGDDKTYRWSLILMLIGFVTLPLLQGTVTPLILIGLVINTIFINSGLAIGYITFKSTMVNSVNETHQGMITGVDEGILAFGRVISPLMAGAIYTAIGMGVFEVFALVLGIPIIYTYIKYYR